MLREPYEGLPADFAYPSGWRLLGTIVMVGNGVPTTTFCLGNAHVVYTHALNRYQISASSKFFATDDDHGTHGEPATQRKLRLILLAAIDCLALTASDGYPLYAGPTQVGWSQKG